MWKLITTLSLLATSITLWASTQNLALEDCHVKGIKEKVQCGNLQVLENYQKPEGATIDINVVVLPAIDRTSRKEPLMFLAGGPGQAATELAAHIRRVFSEVRKTRDIILVDQRGTGKSSPLECDETIEKSQNIYTSGMSDLKVDDIRECVSTFTHDLSQFNSENAIRDFDSVRAALGHETINVYGGSYGTRAALVYMRMFPQQLRSVVLDSVGPIEVPIGPFGQSAAQSFQALVDNCKAELACEKAFPNIEQEFQQVFESLVKAPKTITILHPRLGTPIDMVVDGEKFINSIRMQLYSMEGRTMVPLVIHQAYQGNYMPLAGLLARQDTTDSEGGMYMGLTLNIVCNEDYPKVSVQDWNADANNQFGRNISHRLWRLACPVWPKYRPDNTFYKSVTADIPTLILSGKLDPVTPPSNGEESHQTLPKSRHIVVKNAAHIVAGNTCALELIDQFLDDLKPEELDDKCLTEIPDESFMTSLNGNI